MTDNISLADIAAVTDKNNDGDWGGGAGAWWMIILFAMIWGWGRGGFGGNGTGGGEPVTESGLCNAMNFNNLENAVGRLGDTQQAQFTQLTNGICNLGYELQGQNNATNMNMMQGFNATQAQLAQCCCDTQRAIDGVNYNNAMNTAAINANTTAGIQKILDTMCQNQMNDMQNQINQLQLNAALCGVVRYPNATTYTAGFSPYWNQGCGCGTYANAI